jgi:hypothetical protein
MAECARPRAQQCPILQDLPCGLALEQNMQKSRLKIVLAALTVVAVIHSAGSARAGAGLDGSIVNVSAYFPNTNSLFESGGNTTVSGAIEYPAGTFLMYDRFAQIDITDDQIVIKNTLAMDAPYNSASFNGWVLTIVSGPAISSAEIDPASQCNPVGISIVDGNQLFLNFEGVTQGAGTSSIIDLTPVPEPSTAALATLGLPVLLAFFRRKA